MAAFYSTSKFANWVVFECPLFEKELRAYLPLADFLRHRVYRTIERRYRLTAADRCTFVSCRSPRFFRTPAFLEAHCTVIPFYVGQCLPSWAGRSKCDIRILCEKILLKY